MDDYALAQVRDFARSVRRNLAGQPAPDASALTPAQAAGAAHAGKLDDKNQVRIPEWGTGPWGRRGRFGDLRGHDLGPGRRARQLGAQPGPGFGAQVRALAQQRARTPRLPTPGVNLGAAAESITRTPALG